MNVITLTGNSVREIELSYSPQGTAFAKGAIAVRRDFKNQQGEYETDFINFTSIGKVSEVIANYVNKGDKFGITGRLQIRTFDKDGVRQYFTEVVVNSFDFPSKSDNGQGQGNTPSRNQTSNSSDNGQYPTHNENGYRGPNSEHVAPNQQNYTRVEEDPFARGSGPIEVSDDDLPF
jgi:single-strand DNA-binding protein